MQDTLLENIKQAVIDSDAEIIPVLTEKAIKEGLEPLDIIDKALVVGMQVVGEKYESGEYFLPHLIISATGMKKSCLLYTSPSPRDRQRSRMPSSA